MNKIMKSTALTLGALGAVASPIATVVSCGGSAKDSNTVYFAMRFSDWEFWEPVAKEFTEATGINVEFRISGNQLSEYTAWHGAGSMPDVVLADQNTIGHAARNNTGWFADINIEEFGSAKNDFTTDIESEKTTFDFTSSADYDQSIYAGVKSGDNTISTVPYGYGAGTIYINNNLVDETKTIKAYVPKLEATASDTAEADRFTIVDTGMKATRENVTRFVMSAGDQNDKGWDDGADAPEGWVTHGPLAQHQRMASIGLSTIGTAAPDGWQSGWDPNGLIGNIGFGFDQIASLADIYDAENNYIDDEKLQDVFQDTNGKTDEWVKENLGTDALEPLFQAVYGYFAGTEVDGRAVTPTQLSEPGKAEVMYPQEASILEGAKWYMHGYLEPNWHINGVPGGTPSQKVDDLYDSLYAIPASYASIGYDSLAIASQATGVWKENAMKFIRFATSMANESENAFDITGGKVTSPFTKAKELEENNIDDEMYFPSSDYGFDAEAEKDSDETVEEFAVRIYAGGTTGDSDLDTKVQRWYQTNLGKRDLYKTFVQSGLKWDSVNNEVSNEPVDALKGISGGIVASSSDGLYNIFNEILSNSSRSIENSFKDETAPVSYDKIVSTFNSALAEVYQQIALG